MITVRPRPRKKATWWGRVKSALGFGRSGAYEAASVSDRGRRAWSTSNAGPNAIGGSAPLLRARSRDMARNDPHCARAVEVLAGNVVGSGVSVSVGRESLSDAEAARVELLWAGWCARAADLEGVHAYAALEAVAARGWVEAGECFIRRVIDTSLVALGQVPLRIEVLEADLLDEQRSEALAGGGRIVQGVEFDSLGRRVAYWFLPEHPGEGYPFGGLRSASIRVPAIDVIHLFLPLRPRQVRGLPFLAPVLAMKADLETFERWELARKQTEAAVSAFVIPGDNAESEDDEGLIPRTVDADGQVVEDIQPRLILSLRNGKDVRFNTPQISGNYDVYKRSMLQSCAVGLMLSYEWLSGDLSQANYSSLRGGLLEFWRYVESLQYTHFVPKVTARVWQWWCEAAFLAGLIPTPFVAAEFTAPARQSVDPARESLGDILDIRSGLVPWEDKVAARGQTPRKVLAKQAELSRELDLLGLILDVDPRKMAFRGAFRTDREVAEDGGVSPPPGGGAPDDVGSDP